MEQVVHALYECTPCIYGHLTVRCMVWLIVVKGGGGVYPGIDAILSCDKGYGYGYSVTIKCGTDGKYALQRCEVSQRALVCQIGSLHVS